MLGFGQLPGHEARADAGRLQPLEVIEHRQNRLHRYVGRAEIHSPNDRSERRQLERAWTHLDGLLSPQLEILDDPRESQIACPSMHEHGHAAWSVSASTSGRRDRRCGTRTSSNAMPSRARARATLPHGHSQLVGVVQRYSVAIVGLGETIDARARRQIAAGEPELERLACAGWRQRARRRARGTTRSSPPGSPRAATSSSPARAWPWCSRTPSSATPRGSRRGRHRTRPGSSVLGVATRARARRQRQLDRRRLDARQPAEIGE